MSSAASSVQHLRACLTITCSPDALHVPFTSERTFKYLESALQFLSAMVQLTVFQLPSGRKLPRLYLPRLPVLAWPAFPENFVLLQHRKIKGAEAGDVLLYREKVCLS